MSTRFLAAVVWLLVVSGCSGPQRNSAEPTPPSEDVLREAIRFDTEFGAIIVVLYPEAAPRTVDLMKTYVAEGYYVNREFNRAVPGHVIQITDKAGGVTDDGRRVPLETHASFHFSAGAVGIARGADPNSGGPEFFIMDFATSHLDGNYTVWGQVVEGLDAVHRAARVPAIDFSQTPGVGAAVIDRMAVDPVAITGTQLVSYAVDRGAWDHFPLVVAKNKRVGDFRHSLEWPKSLEAGRSANLTWYVRPYNETAPPAANAVQIRIADQLLAVTAEAETAGIYHWQWAPGGEGSWDAAFLVDGNEWATLVISVAPRKG